jgi:uncharacterized protein (PEP-CTERM system associated)
MSTLSLSLGQEFENSASAFAADQGIGVIGLTAVAGQQTAEPFTSRHAALTWSLAGNRTRLFLSGAWQDQEYDQQPLFDQSLTSLEATLHRDLSAAFMAQLRVVQDRGEFEQLGDYTDSTAGLSIQWRLSRRLAVNFAYDYAHRNGDALAGDYSENRFWLSIGYQRGTPRSALHGGFLTDAGDAAE